MKLFRQMVDDLTRVYPEGEARALVRRMFEDGFGLSQTDVLLGKDSELSADDIANAQEIVTRLLRHEPIQYILGTTMFCGHRFVVGPGALIPRPETEQLIGLILGHPSTAPDASILDIGTGTGCIALSLALALPQARVTAWDVSTEALAVARRNAELHSEAHVLLEQADILCPPTDERLWDIIVSNPPYICQHESALMQANVLDYEPHTALFVPDDDPLLFYRAIARFSTTHLTSGGQLWFELNEAYGQRTARLLQDFGFCNIRLLEDSFGKQRFICAEKVDEMGDFETEC